MSPPGKSCFLDLNRDWTLSRNFPNLHSGLFIANINILSILSGAEKTNIWHWKLSSAMPRELCYRYVRNEETSTICLEVDQSKLQVMEEDKKLRRYSYFGRSSQQEKLEVQSLSFVKLFYKAGNKMSFPFKLSVTQQGRWLERVRRCSSETKPLHLQPTPTLQESWPFQFFIFIQSFRLKCIFTMHWSLLTRWSPILSG